MAIIATSVNPLWVLLWDHYDPLKKIKLDTLSIPRSPYNYKLMQPPMGFFLMLQTTLKHYHVIVPVALS